MDRILATQLEFLQTDHIDYYLLHSLDRRFWNKMLRHDALEFLEKNKKKGQIINAGFSFHGDKDVFKEIVDAYDWDFCQIQYNYLDEQNQAGTEGLDYAAQKGLGVIVMEPLRGGMLTKKIPPHIESIWNEADVPRTPAEWALRWIWNHPQVTCILIQTKIDSKRSACPFLDKTKSCIIYHKRPLSCRAFTSRDAQMCKQSVNDGTIIPQQAISYRIYQVATTALLHNAQNQGCPHRQVPFIPALLSTLRPEIFYPLDS